MDPAPLSQNRPILGTVELSVPFNVIMGLDNFGNRDVVSYPLPGVLRGSIRVHHRLRTETTNMMPVITVEVEDLPKCADVLLHCQLKWRTHGGINATFSDDWSTQCLWLQGNGCIAQLLRGHTYEVSGTATVYGRPKPSPIVYGGAMRSLATLSDVVLRAAGAEFPAHRLVLAARSPVLLAMFTGDYKETRDRAVDIAVDCSAEVFGLFVDFLYEGVLCDLGCGELIPLLELSERYMVAELKAECVRQLLAMLDERQRDCGELIPLLMAAERYMVAELKVECVRQLLAVGVGDALAVFRAALDLPFVPDEVGRKAGELIRSNWRAVSELDAWADFTKARPDVARALKLYTPPR